MNTVKKKTLGECATIIPGVMPQEKKGKELLSYVAVLPGQITHDGLGGSFGSVLRDTPCGEEQFLAPGDILIKRLNPDCAVVFEDGDRQIIPSVNVFAIRPQESLEPYYLAFLLEKSNLLSRISQLSGIGTTVAAVTAPQIAGTTIPLPPLEKQKELGMLWKLAKRQDTLLRQLMTESDRLLRALGGKLYR